MSRDANKTIKSNTGDWRGVLQSDLLEAIHAEGDLTLKALVKIMQPKYNEMQIKNALYILKGTWLFTIKKNDGDIWKIMLTKGNINLIRRQWV